MTAVYQFWITKNPGMAKLEEIITEIRLRWLGHVIWMVDCSIPNQAFNWNLSSRNRKPGRPRKNWQDIIWMDLHCKGHRSWRQRVSFQWFLFRRTALGRSRKAVSCFFYSVRLIRSSFFLIQASGAAREEGGEASRYGWTSKNYVMCVLSLSWNFFVSHD